MDHQLVLCDISRGVGGKWHICEFEGLNSLCGKKVTEMIPPMNPLAYVNDRKRLSELVGCETCLEKMRTCLPRPVSSPASLASARIASSGQEATGRSSASAHTVQLSLES